MTPPRWIIPLEPGPLVDGAPRLVVTVTDELLVDISVEHGVDPPVLLFASLTACQLGQALQDASKWCGQERARREARGRKR